MRCTAIVAGGAEKDPEPSRLHNAVREFSLIHPISTYEVRLGVNDYNDLMKQLDAAERLNDILASSGNL